MILLYHHVAPLDAVPDDPDPLLGWNFRLSPEEFEFQLRRVRELGYRFTSLGDHVRELRATGREPSRTAQVTFDDGHVDNYLHALPVLRKLAIPATFFVTTDHLQRQVDDPDKMNVAQLRELLDAGMTVGGHTRSHRDLTLLPPAETRGEIEGCREDLAKSLGIEADLFAYPGGAFNARIADETREAGYVAACSVLGPMRNDRSSLYWLFRDTLTAGMDTPADRYRLSPFARRALEFRVRRRLRARLGAPA